MMYAGPQRAFGKNLKIGLENICEEVVVVVAVAIVFHM